MHVLAGPDPEFSIGGRVGIILKSGGQVKSVLNVLPDRDILPGLEIGRIENQSTRDVHRARGRYPDRGYLMEIQSGRGHRLADRFRHLPEAVFLSSGRFGRKSHPAQGLAVVVNNAPLDGGTADIDAYEMDRLLHKKSPQRHQGHKDNSKESKGRAKFRELLSYLSVLCAFVVNLYFAQLNMRTTL